MDYLKVIFKISKRQSIKIIGKIYEDDLGLLFQNSDFTFLVGILHKAKVTGKKTNNEKKILLGAESTGRIQLQENPDFSASSPTPFPCLFQTLEEVCEGPKNIPNT